MSAVLESLPAPSSEPGPRLRSLDDLLESLGGIPASRIPLVPNFGHSDEADVRRWLEAEGRLFELYDGVLVEKPMGLYESVLAGVLVQLLRNYLDAHPLGTVSVPDGAMRVAPGQVRFPDVAFISRERFVEWGRRRDWLLHCAPDLAVEILSPANTPAEMERKIRDYFAGGTRLVWLLDPAARTARVFTSPDAPREIGPSGELDGGGVLPGFRLSLVEWFARADGDLHP